MQISFPFTVQIVNIDRNDQYQYVAGFTSPNDAVNYATELHKKNAFYSIRSNIYVWNEEENHVIKTFYFGEEA